MGREQVPGRCCRRNVSFADAAILAADRVTIGLKAYLGLAELNGPFPLTLTLSLGESWRTRWVRLEGDMGSGSVNCTKV